MDKPRSNSTPPSFSFVESNERTAKERTRKERPKQKRRHDELEDEEILMLFEKISEMKQTVNLADARVTSLNGGKSDHSPGHKGGKRLTSGRHVEKKTENSKTKNKLLSSEFVQGKVVVMEKTKVSNHSTDGRSNPDTTTQNSSDSCNNNNNNSNNNNKSNNNNNNVIIESPVSSNSPPINTISSPQTVLRNLNLDKTSDKLPGINRRETFARFSNANFRRPKEVNGPLTSSSSSSLPSASVPLNGFAPIGIDQNILIPGLPGLPGLPGIPGFFPPPYVVHHFYHHNHHEYHYHHPQQHHYHNYDSNASKKILQ